MVIGHHTLRADGVVSKSCLHRITSRAVLNTFHSRQNIESRCCVIKPTLFALKHIESRWCGIKSVGVVTIVTMDTSIYVNKD